VQIPSYSLALENFIQLFLSLSAPIHSGDLELESPTSPV
jgi:hypothetical protein